MVAQFLWHSVSTVLVLNVASEFHTMKSNVIILFSKIWILKLKCKRHENYSSHWSMKDCYLINWELWFLDIWHQMNWIKFQWFQMSYETVTTVNNNYWRRLCALPYPRVYRTPLLIRRKSDYQFLEQMRVHSLI